MKTLTLLRHAKSKGKDGPLEDLERPLSRGGKEAASRMGQRLAEKGLLPDLILTSPARRAVGTARRVANKIGFGKKKIRQLDGIYEASAEDLLAMLRELDASCDHVMLVGHNPGFTELNNLVNSFSIDQIPTCGVVCSELDIAAWPELLEGQGRLVFYDYPGQIRK
jgi:phosphohistidine phosphatase